MLNKGFSKEKQEAEVSLGVCRPTPKQSVSLGKLNKTSATFRTLLP